MNEDTARAILDDLFRKGAGAIIHAHGSAHYCQACRAVLWDQFDSEITEEHKTECPYTRYRRMLEEEKLCYLL